MYRPIILGWNSGAGKDKIADGVVDTDSSFVLSQARVMTRMPRPNEEGVTFVDRVTFDSHEKTWRIIWAYTGIGDQRYGIDTEMLQEELQNHHPILPFWGDTLETQQKYLMDLAWFCRENGYPIPLYYLLTRSDIENQANNLKARWLPEKETKKRLARINNRNTQIVTWWIMRKYEWLVQLDNIEWETEETIQQFLWLFQILNNSVGSRFFRERHERP